MTCSSAGWLKKKRILWFLTAVILTGCAGSKAVYLDKTLPLESVIVARFSFEYGGIATYEVEEDEESDQIRGIIPSIVRAVNWVSEMNQITLIHNGKN